MKQYKVTTEVSLIVEAEDEDDAACEARFIMQVYPERIDDYSDYYEVEEVSD